MNGYNFSERVRKVLQMAREEAQRLRHEYVGTEHMLLGLVREGGGVAAAVLANRGVNPDEVRRIIEETVKKGPQNQATGPDLPYTSRAKKVLELSMSAARELNHSYVGTEHLLLGLLREEKGIAAQVLHECGLAGDAAADEVKKLLGTPFAGSATGNTGVSPGTSFVRGTSPPPAPVSITITIEFEGGVISGRRFANFPAAVSFLNEMQGVVQ